jgi:hypothetical protein
MALSLWPLLAALVVLALVVWRTPRWVEGVAPHFFFLAEEMALRAAREGLELAGPQRMQLAVMGIVEVLPWWARAVLEGVARLTDSDVESLVKAICQATFERVHDELTIRLQCLREELVEREAP